MPPVPSPAPALRVGLLAALALVLSACGMFAPPSPVGRWQVEGNPQAGLEIRPDGQFQGELGPAGQPRLRLEGTWTASGSDLTLNIGGALAKIAPGATFVGKINGDTLTLSPPQGVEGASGTITLKKQPDRR